MRSNVGNLPPPVITLNRRQVCVSLLYVPLAVVSATEAADGSGAGRSFHLLPVTFEISNLSVQSPPADDLIEAELLLSMKPQRTEEKLAEIQAESVNPLPLFWHHVGLDASTYPMHARWITEAVVDTESVLLDLKRQFNRRRPSAVLPEISPVIPVPPHASYPSGHATQAVVIARLLSRLAPAASRDLMKLALRVGRNREVAGVHYPSDTCSGFSLGRQLSAIFLSSPPPRP